jgi:glycosyltransferase involved in cell wall biosynthesis
VSGPVVIDSSPISDITRSLATRAHSPAINGDQVVVPRERAGDPRRSSVSLVIPAKNEARNLATVLDHLPDCVDEVILVDGKSSDVTQLMATTCLPDILIIEEPAAGKGHALRAGFQAATSEIIVAMDADGSMLPQEIPQIIYFLDHGFDFVKGSRFVAGGGSLDITLLRKMGNRGLLMLANHFFETQLTDLCYGFFGFRRQYLAHLGLTSAGFEIETELTVRAVNAGLRIAEVPSLEMPRRSGKSSLRSFHDGYRVLRTLLHERQGSRQRAITARIDAVAID